MIIYKVTNLVNNKIYIGQSVNSLQHRKSEHYKDAKRLNRNTVYFHNALLKYNKEDFRWEIVDNSNSIEELNAKEIYWISYYNSTNKEKGYNLKAGGNGGGLCCESTKQKIGETTKQKWKNPKIAKRMLEGLQKGTETVKQQALVNFKSIICNYCGKEFTYRPCDTAGHTPKFCSDECLSLYRKNYNPGLEIANKKNKELKNQEKDFIKQKIFNWLPNFKKFKNLPLNRLNPLFEELMPICGYKDPRTLMSVLNITSKKNFYKELSKIYAELIGNYENQEIKSS